MSSDDLNTSAFEANFPIKTAFKVGIFGMEEHKKSLGWLIGLLGPLILLIIFLPIMLFLFSVFMQDGFFSGLLWFIFLTGILSLIVYGVAIVGTRILRIYQFCLDNNFAYFPSPHIQDETGILFDKGHSRKASHGISGMFIGKPCELFGYQYTTGSGKNQHTYSFGVAKTTLDRSFPHILLDNKRDSSVGQFEFDRSQKLELEGDFNKYFNVFGPKEYEVEVLQILNPAVMATLIDLPESVDIEIIGNQLYVYNSGSLKSKKTILSLFKVLEQINNSTKSVQRSFTMPANIGDARPVLKKSKVPIIVFILFAIIWLGAQILSAIN